MISDTEVGRKLKIHLRDRYSFKISFNQSRTYLGVSRCERVLNLDLGFTLLSDGEGGALVSVEVSSILSGEIIASSMGSESTEVLSSVLNSSTRSTASFKSFKRSSIAFSNLKGYNHAFQENE